MSATNNYNSTKDDGCRNTNYNNHSQITKTD